MIEPVRPLLRSPAVALRNGLPLLEGPLGRWGGTAAAALTGLGLLAVLDPHLPAGMALLALVPVVGVAALLSGTVPALALAVSILGVAWFRFATPQASFAPEPPEAVALVLFALIGAAEVASLHLLRSAVRPLAKSEAEARALAGRNALLFAELQHRIASNLTVIGALLARRGREVGDPCARRALDEAAARLGVVARLSRRLHNPEDEEIDLAEVLRWMVPEVLSVAGAECRIGIDLDAERVVVPAARAVPLALVTSELLSNAVGHGFPGTEGGRIEIRLERTGPATARLLLRHDGLGLPSGFRLSRARGLGLTIADQLAEMVEADLLVVEDRGVVSCLTFPVEATIGFEQAEDRSASLRPDRDPLPAALRAPV